MDNQLRKLLLEAPDQQLDASMKALIEKWDAPPTALQVLRVLDQCTYWGLASDFVMGVLNTILEACIENEGTTLADVAAKATWRELG